MYYSVVECTADTLIRTEMGIVHGIHICFDGVTAGDKVEIRDAVAAAAGTVRFTFVADATDQSYAFTPHAGMKFSTGIFVDVIKTGGSMYVTVVYE